MNELINNGITQSSSVLPSPSLSGGENGLSDGNVPGGQVDENLTSRNEIMKQMRLLFGRQQYDMKRTIENVIAQLIQPLNSTII